MVRYVRIALFLSAICAALIISSILAVGSVLYFLPKPEIRILQEPVLYDSDGARLSDDFSGEQHHWVSLSEIAPSAIESTIATEDQRFYQHFGVDLKRIGGAIIKNVMSMRKAEGASTITQQLARNLYLSHEKTWMRKLNELFYSLRLEMHYDKDTLLEAYLNTIYYGEGAYGIESAARTYYNKHANELTIAEGALLAGIPKAPTYYSPRQNPDRANERKN
ncbi:MAG: transglycosylase domain-containing protein, partial [Bacilli bacterium]